MNAYDIIRRPVITEQSMEATDQKKYVFIVANDANKIEIKNTSDGCVFEAGDEITFEGVADDLGSPIEAIEFSFDGGATWTSCATEGATADKWVNWQFSTSFEDAGDYRMTVRAKTADGMVSPLAATLLFQVS